MKTCGICKVEQPKENFNTGQAYCRPCQVKYQKQRYKKPHVAAKRKAKQEALWREHREVFAERMWRRLCQSAQDSRGRYNANKIRLQKQHAEALARRQSRPEYVQWLKNMELNAERKRIKEAKRVIGLKKNADNMELNAKRKAARKERDVFLASWKKKYGPLFVSLKVRTKIQEARRRKNLNMRPRDKGVAALKELINNTPQTCYWCGISLPNGAEADHVIPVARGGTDTKANIVASCRPCNAAKLDKLPCEATFITQPVFF